MDSKTTRRPRLEEPFVVTAMLSLVTATVWLALRPALLLEFWYSPELLAVTHVITLGFATSLIMGVLLRLAPMAIHVEPRSAVLARAQFALHLVGTLGMVFHFGLGRWKGLSWSALLVLGAAVLQAIQFAGVFRRARAGDTIARYVAAAIVNLILAASLGAAYGLQNGYGIGRLLLTAPFEARIGAHVHLAAVGWVTTMILGFQLKLVPTTAGSPGLRTFRLALLEAGVLGLAVTLLTSAPGDSVFAALVLVACGWQALGPVRGLRRHPDWIWEALALLLLVGLGAVGLLLTLGVPGTASPFRPRVELAYAFTGLFGWVLLAVTGSALKLFPLWVWKERFEPDWGKKPVPAVASLASRGLRTATGLLLAAGVLGGAAGIVLAWGPLVRVALWLVVAGVVAFVANFIRIARWALLDLEYRPPPG